MTSNPLIAIEEHVRLTFPELHALLIMRNGKIVKESYYGGRGSDIVYAANPSARLLPRSEPYPTGFNRTQVHNVKSVTKSVMSCLIGIALDLGIVASTDLTLTDLLPRRLLSGIDPAKGRISLRHLLTMRSGLHWKEHGDTVHAWATSGDPIGFSLHTQHLVAEPGTIWNYSTADVHLLSACLTSVTGQSALDFADQYLFGPLGFGPHRWTADPQGFSIGGSELCITPRDMARFGLLYLHHGVEAGNQLVSGHWVDLTTSPLPEVDLNTILTSTGVVDTWPADVTYYRNGYGWLWWRTTLSRHAGYLAAGYGGQLVIVVPELDLVVVEAASTDQPDGREPPPEDAFPGIRLVEQFVIPAITGPS